MLICPNCKREVQQHSLVSRRSPPKGEYFLWCYTCRKEFRKSRREKSEHIVYGLFDPRTNECLYVGATSHPKGRLTQHIIDARRIRPGQSPKHVWLRELANAGLKPEMRTLEVTDFASAQSRESYWISRMLSEGVPLLNSHGESKQEMTERFSRRKLPHDRQAI